MIGTNELHFRHRGDKPYKCEYCERSFVIRFELKRHMRTHTGQKPYGCRYCERKFSDFGSRIKHERSHTGERPYICQVRVVLESIELKLISIHLCRLAVRLLRTHTFFPAICWRTPAKSDTNVRPAARDSLKVITSRAIWTRTWKHSTNRRQWVSPAWRRSATKNRSKTSLSESTRSSTSHKCKSKLKNSYTSSSSTSSKSSTEPLNDSYSKRSKSVLICIILIWNRYERNSKVKIN